jgi:ammonia channel protein AmtB
MSINGITQWFAAQSSTTQISVVVFVVFIAIPISTLIIIQFLDSLQRLRELKEAERRRKDGDKDR